METLKEKQFEELLNKVSLNTKTVWTVDEVCEYTGISKNYLYKLTSNKIIPYYKPTGGMIFFDRKEIENWMLQNRQSTKDEIESEANRYSFKNKRRLA